jgi:transcriptional regulator with XRE-family HTH domain
MHDHNEEAQLTIGQIVRRSRRARDMTQSVLADRSGLTINTISRIEKGYMSPRAQTLAKIAAALDVPVGELYPHALSAKDAAPELTAGQFADHGIQPTSAELATLNALLEVYTEMAITGDEGPGTLTVPKGPVNMDRVHMLLDYAVLWGILTPEDIAVLRDGVRAKLVAS